MLININITDKRPQVDGTPVIVCGNNDYQIRFTFDEEWDHSQMKTARFAWRKGGKALYIDVPFVGDTVDVPMLTEVRFVYVGVYTDHLQTTTPARIACEYSIRCNSGEDIQEPTPEDLLIDLFNLVTSQQAAAIEAAGIATKERELTEAAAASAAQSEAEAKEAAAEAFECVGKSSKVLESHLGGSVTFWAGTRAQYDAIPEKAVNCLYIITDDTTAADILAATERACTRAEDANEKAAGALDEAGLAQSMARRVDLTEDVAFSWLLDQSSTPASLNTGFEYHRFEYSTSSDIVHFAFSFVVNGSAQQGHTHLCEYICPVEYAPSVAPARSIPIACTMSDTFEAELCTAKNSQGYSIPALKITIKQDISFGRDLPVNFSGWYFIAKNKG